MLELLLVFHPERFHVENCFRDDAIAEEQTEESKATAGSHYYFKGRRDDGM